MLPIQVLFDSFARWFKGMRMMVFVSRPPLVVLLVVLFFVVQVPCPATAVVSAQPNGAAGLEKLSVEQFRDYLQRAQAWATREEGKEPNEGIKPLRLADTLMQMANTEKRDKHFNESENLIKCAIQLAEQHRFSAHLRANYYFQLGSLYGLMEDHQKALLSLKIAYQWSKESGDDALITACRISIDDLQVAGKSPTRKPRGLHINGGSVIHENTAPALNTKVLLVVFGILLLLVGALFAKWRLAQNKILVKAKKTMPLEEPLAIAPSENKAMAEIKSAEVAIPKKSVWIREKNKRWIHIDVSEIVSIEAKNNNVDMHTLSKTYKEIGVSLLNMSRQLNESGFIRTHRSFLVNTEHLKMIEDNSIFLTKGKAPIGESYRKDLFDTLHLLRSTSQKTQDSSTMESLQHA